MCDGVDTVVATANAIVPRRGERAHQGALTEGYVELGRRAREAGVRRMLFVSVPRHLMGRGAAEFDEKAAIEQGLRRQGPPLTTVRASLFMETWLPAVGSRLPLRGGEQATLDRGFWLTRMLSRTSQQSLDRFGIAQLPGNGRARHSFVAVDDVADVLATAASDPDTVGEELELGGPEPLSWREVVATYEAVTGRRSRAVPTPAAPFRLASGALARVSPAASQLLAGQALVSTVDSPYPATDATRLLGRPPVSVEEFLRARLALPAG